MISDFQLALIGIAALIIVGIVVFNYLQERRYRQRAEKAFYGDHPDVLIDASDLSKPVRLEPSLGDIPTEPGDVVLDHLDAPDQLAPLNTAAGIDPNIDCIGLVLADTPIAHGLLTPFMARSRRLGKPVLWEQLVEGHWQRVADKPYPFGTEPADFRELRIGLQLADRRGPATREEIQYFQDLVNEVATAVSAVTQRVPVDETLARASALDLFCADNDIEIAINIIGRDGSTFALAKVRALAESAGMIPLPSLSDEFVFCDDADSVVFTLRNMDPGQPAGAVRGAGYLTGLTLALDVPRVENGALQLDRVYALARQFATALGGEVVDDNRKPLTAAGAGMIKKTLGDIAIGMSEHGIAPGSPAAKRLFS